MIELVEFLRARYDEDVLVIGHYERYMAERAAAAGSYVLVTPPGWQPGEPFDPDRQRAEVDAKRRILDAYAETIENYGYVRFGEWESCSDDCPEIVLGEVVKLLALPYADRPGWQPEWVAPPVEIRPIPKSAFTEGSS